jgi:dTDP-glucose 4,6-dehydratase
LEQSKVAGFYFAKRSYELRILVTGGLGIIGRPLVAELVRRGNEVWSCDLYQHHDPRYIRCDVGRLRQVQRMFSEREFDCVYHLAAEFGRHNGEDYYENLWMSNVVGTKNLLELQREKGFRMVFFSSSEVYGDYDGVMSEQVMEQHAIRQMNDYAMSKWVGEMQVANATDLFGIETVRVRLFNIYGPGEYYSPYRSALCVFCYRALTGQPHKVYTDHHRTSLYITDAVRTLGNICENFHPGEVYNIGGTEYHDMRAVSDMILRCVGSGDDLVEYVESEPMTTKDKRVDITRAARDLGHAPAISLQEGIPMTVEWMKKIYADQIGS